MCETEAGVKKTTTIKSGEPVRGKLYFPYGETEIAYLKGKDATLGRAMDEIGHLYREVIPDLFMALVNAIIGQQISTKAQETVWARFQERFAPVTPAHIAAIPDEELQACGISFRKAAYIKGVANNILDGSLDLHQLSTMPDAEVCKRLSQLSGIGVWTAEMLMIFSMQRPDVISWGDMAIIRGLRMLYRHREITPALFARYKRRYSPYATIASLYLWEISHHSAWNGRIDPAPKTGKKKP